MPPIPKRKTERETPRVEFVHVGREELAVNLFDLDRIEETVRGALLADKLVLTDTVWVDKNRVDEIAVVFKCPLLQAACILDIIRGRDRKAKQPPTRAYMRIHREWVRVPSGVLFTLVEDGRTVLNPAAFKIEARLTEIPKAEAPKGGARKVFKRKS